MNVGSELERARMSRGLSLEDVSARTKVSLERLAAIEQNDVEHLPPVVYLRGFVRQYATEVGLDADEVTDRYLAQFEAQALNRLDHAESKGPAHRADDEVGPVHVAANRAQVEEPPATVSTAAPLWQPAQFLPDPIRDHIKPDPPRDHIKADPPRDHINAETEALAPAPAATARTTATSRLPVRALLLTIAIALVAGFLLSANLDRLRGATGVSQVAPSAADQAKAGKSNDEVAAAASSSSDASEKPGELTSAPDPARADVRHRPEAAADAGDASRVSVSDVSGNWTLTNRVEEASYKPFENLTLGYRVQLEQRGNSVTGSGRKATENGRTIAAASQTPISFEGTLNGRRLELRFAERGNRRTSGGTMLLDLTDDGSLRGSFVSDAARSRGSAQATRIP